MYSIIIPAFNEDKTISDIIKRIHKVFSELKYKYEIIVVCDGCSDKTESISKKSNAIVIVNKMNKGYGASIKIGALNAKGNFIITIDADGQHNPEDIKKLIPELKDNDMVVASRKNNNSSLFWVRPGKLLIQLLANSLAKSKIPDLNSGLRLIKKTEFLSLIPILPNSFSLSTTTTIAFLKTGLQIKYVEVNFKKRVGKGSLSILDGITTLGLVIRIFTLFSPLRIFIPISIFFATVGSYYTISSYLINDMASLKGIITMSFSIIILLFGLVVDQIAALRRGEKIK